MGARATTIAMSLLGMLLVLGCSDSGNAPVGGTLKVNLVDAPGDYDAVWIEIDRVEVHRAGEDSSSGWHVVRSNPGTYDLLQLRNGVSAALVDGQLPPGDYTQMRLVLGAGCSVDVDGQSHELSVPSGMRSGLKLNHPFTIGDDAIYEVTLDFDAARSIHRTGNGRYMLRPVIRAMAVVTSGSLRGVAMPIEARAAITAVAGTDTFTAVADTTSGAYRFPCLPEGTYDLDFAATSGAYRDTTLFGVPVVRMQTTVVDTVTLGQP